MLYGATKYRARTQAAGGWFLPPFFQPCRRTFTPWEVRPEVEARFMEGLEKRFEHNVKRFMGK